MLVRFLSYAASVIGARRYKPLLITCFALVFSITGISIVATALSSDSPGGASHAGQAADKAGTSQQSTSQLNGLESKTPKDSKQVSPPSTAQNNASSNTPTTGTPTNDNPAAAIEITLNTSTVSLSQGNSNAAVSVSANGSGNLQWSITSDTPVAGLNARIDNVKDNPSNAIVRLASDNVASGTYQYTVTAKDVARSVSASKTISVTIN